MESGIFCLYKPAGITSFAAINELKHRFKVKTGHSGTLDPQAEGILVVAVNRATKALPYLNVSDKVYEATLTLGIKTDTGDIWGQTLETVKVTPLDETNVKSVLNSFVGEMRQRVPMVSAKKIDGKKLYEYHRHNEVVETQYTNIEIYDIRLIAVTETTISFTAHVSNGTYIRTLCEDIAEKLNTCGTMSALKRIQVGKFTLKDSHCLDDIEHLDTVLLPIQDHLAIPTIVDNTYRQAILHGKQMQLPTQEPIVFVDCDDIYAVCQRCEDGMYKVKRGLW